MRVKSFSAGVKAKRRFAQEQRNAQPNPREMLIEKEQRQIVIKLVEGLGQSERNTKMFLEYFGFIPGTPGNYAHLTRTYNTGKTRPSQIIGKMVMNLRRNHENEFKEHFDINTQAILRRILKSQGR